MSTSKSIALFARLICLSVLFWPLSAFCISDIHYTITPILNENALEIELSFNGSKKNHVYIPISWTGEAFEEITDLETHSTPIASNRRDKSNKKESQHIVAKYRVKTNETYPNNRSTCDQEETFFRFAGDFFVIPSNIDYDEKQTITLEWKGIPQEWVIANSFGIQTKKQQITTSFSSLRGGLYVGGAFNVLRCGEEENAPYVVVKESNAFSSESLLPVLQTIFQDQQTFWNDHDFPYFLITILPIEEQQPHHAQAYLNSFIAILPPFADEEWKWEWMKWVLAHELFHTWIPYKMMPTVPEDFNTLQWFTEGFVEYYAGALNYRSKMLTETQIVKEFNKKLYSYYTSPHRNVPNEKLQYDPGNDFALRLMPYDRGCLFALYLNDKIQKKTNGANTLDHFLLLMRDMVKETGKPFSLEMIKELLGIYIGKEAATKAIQSYIINGKTITPPDQLLETNTQIEWVENVGFNLNLSKLCGLVHGTRPDSTAHKSGLRDRQTFKKFYRSKDGLLNVVIIENGKEHTISYPSEKGEPIPQYKILPSRA